MKKLLVSAALASIAGLALSGCGNPKSDPVADQAKATMAKQLSSSANARSIIPTGNAATAACIANGIVDKVGVKSLIGYGFIDASGKATTANLSAVTTTPQDATTIVDTLFGCVGDAALVASFQAQNTTSTTLSAAAKACVLRTLDKATIRTVLIADLEGRQSVTAQATLKPITATLLACTKLK